MKGVRVTNRKTCLVYVTLTFDSKVLSVIWKVLCYLHAICNQCAKYEHYRSKNEGGVRVPKLTGGRLEGLRTDGDQLQYTGHFHKIYTCTFQIRFFFKNVLTLIVTVATSAVNMRTQIQANASLISVLDLIIHQNDRVV